MNDIELITPISRDRFSGFLSLKEKEKSLLLSYLLLQLKKRISNPTFLDEDGEEVAEDDLLDYLENFNKIYV